MRDGLYEHGPADVARGRAAIEQRGGGWGWEVGGWGRRWQDSKGEK